MTYRDDHEAAIMRADAAERERGQLVAENARLEAELATAREWLGGPRKRLFVFAAIGIAAIASVFVGVVIGRSTVACPDCVAAPVKREYLPTIAGVIVADGPKVGHWTLNATRCAPREDGVELTTVNSTDQHIWLTNNTIEVEVPDGTFFLDKHQCFSKLSHVVTKTDDGRYEGFVELDCRFEDNRIQGRIDFKHCH